MKKNIRMDFVVLYLSKDSSMQLYAIEGFGNTS